jgi:hypothetical protein
MKPNTQGNNPIQKEIDVIKIMRMANLPEYIFTKAWKKHLISEAKRDVKERACNCGKWMKYHYHENGNIYAMITYGAF